MVVWFYVYVAKQAFISALFQNMAYTSHETALRPIIMQLDLQSVEGVSFNMFA